MKERPILFKSEMVRAILEGRKVMTRRVVNDRHLRMIDTSRAPMRATWTHPMPYGKPGDRLWVRETWMENHHGVTSTDGHGQPIYRASWGNHPDEYWRPSIHMPRWASRILLEVTEVRVERLQDISEADAEAEGVERWVVGDNGWRDYELTPEDEATAGVPPMTAKQSFKTLWQSINGPDSWDLNPLAWVVSFRRLP